MITDYFNQLVTITHVVEDPTTRDSYGNLVRTEPDTLTVSGYLEPLTETSQLVEAETYRTLWRLFLPPGTPVKVTDQLTVDGAPYVIEEVLPFINPRTGEGHHLELHVLQVQG